MPRISGHPVSLLPGNTTMMKGVHIMKKLISCVLVVMMLFTVAGAFAEQTGLGRFGRANIVSRFVKGTDLKTKDIALQVESGDKAADLVIRVDKDNLHLVSRDNAMETSHVQLNPTGIYVSADGTVSLLRYATVASAMQKIVDAVNAAMEEAVNSIPEEALPTQAEIKSAINELGILASAAEEQAQADATTLSSAAVAFASKFKPEYILDVREEEDRATVSLRSDAFASALAEAMDELMSNPDLAELVNRQAAQTGGEDFATLQENWLNNREATLEAIRTIESTEAFDENGHWVSHYQIAEDSSTSKILMCDTDAWIDDENGEADITTILGIKGEAPLLVYELSVSPDSTRETLNSGDSRTDVQFNFEDGLVDSGSVLCMSEGNEAIRMNFGPDYFYMRGPKGGISTSVRETWTGKIHYEVVAETADGQESTIIFDCYEDADSLVCEMNADDSVEPVCFKLSRIDKVNVEDLSASKNVNEITFDINGDLESLVKSVIMQDK